MKGEGRIKAARTHRQPTGGVLGGCQNTFVQGSFCLHSGVSWRLVHPSNHQSLQRSLSLSVPVSLCHQSCLSLCHLACLTVLTCLACDAVFGGIPEESVTDRRNCCRPLEVQGGPGGGHNGQTGASESETNSLNDSW